MASSLREWYDTYVEAGFSREHAMRKAFVDSTREDEQKQVDNGTTYEDDLVRVSVVHARQDIALLSLELMRANKLLAGLRVRLTVVVILLAVIVLILASR